MSLQTRSFYSGTIRLSNLPCWQASCIALDCDKKGGNSMNGRYRIAIILGVSFALTLGSAARWCQAHTGNDISDDRDNTGGGTYALHSNPTGSYNTGYGGNALYFNS